MVIPFGFSRIVPSCSTTSQGPWSFAGPLAITVTLRASGPFGWIVIFSVVVIDLIDIAPEGHAFTVASTLDLSAPSNWIQGRSRGLNTSGRLWKQTPEWMQSSGCHTIVRSEFLYSFFIRHLLRYEGYRAVVTSHFCRHDIAINDRRQERIGHNKIVNPPADVFFPCSKPGAPPAVPWLLGT